MLDHVKQPSQTAKEVDNVSVPCEALASASKLVEQDGNFLTRVSICILFIQYMISF